MAINRVRVTERTPRSEVGSDLARRVKSLGFAPGNLVEKPRAYYLKVGFQMVYSFYISQPSMVNRNVPQKPFVG